MLGSNQRPLCVKAVRYIAGDFWSLQNSCKSPYFCLVALLISEDVLGLLYGCYTYTVPEEVVSRGGKSH